MGNVVELGSAAARERAAQAKAANAAEEITTAQEASQSQPIVQATTAFIVAWIDGQVIPVADLNAPIVVDHYPTPDEIIGAAAVLMADRTAERTAALSAQETLGQLEQKQKQAVAAMQKAQNDALAEQLLERERNSKRPR